MHKSSKQILSILNQLNESVESDPAGDSVQAVTEPTNESEIIGDLISKNTVMEESADLVETELVETTKKVVRDGKVLTLKVKVKRPKKLTSKQKRALAKARKKSHTSSADRERMKSMRVRSRKIK